MSEQRVWPVGGIAGEVAQFNDLVPVGSPVVYWPGVRAGAGVPSRTRSRAWLLGDHTPVVMVEGYAGGVALTHVLPHPRRDRRRLMSEQRHSTEKDAGRALAERLTSDEMVSQVQWAISEAQTHGHVEYKRRVGYHGRVTIAKTVLDAICEALEIPTSIDLLMDPQLSTHDTCADLLREVANGGTNPMHGLQGALVVSDERPEITLPEFPPTALRCPHGTQFWVYPDGARVAALRDLNYPTDRTETKP